MILLSERMNPEPPPNVLIRDDVSLKLRNQIRHIAKIHLDRIPMPGSQFDLVDTICFIYRFDKGWEPRDSYSFSHLDSLLSKTKPVDFLDLVDIMCQVLYRNAYFGPESWNSFQSELDHIMISNHMGYRVSEGKLIPITEPMIANEVIMPAFQILHKHNLDKAREELMAAFRHYGDGEYPDALSSAYKALETVIETCLIKRSIDFNPGEKTTAKIDKLVQSGLLPNYLQDSMNSLSKMLGAVGNIRNNTSGHGSATEKVIPESLVQYQLDIAASSILYIVRSVFGE